jgi:uncharacterized membrane protein YhaH (DUF805 family)
MLLTHAPPCFVIFAAVLGLATVLGAVAGTEYYLGQLRAGRPIGWIEAVTSELFRWYAWALLVPAIAWLARRIRDLAPHWWMAAPLHAVAAVAVAWLQTRDYRDYDMLMRDGARVRLSRTYRDLLESRLGERL